MGETDDFEWDDAKDEVNTRERGLPLAVAALMFDGRPRVERPSRKSAGTETRYETRPLVEDRVVFCVWIWNGKRRRVISLRIAHQRERRAYHEAVGGG